MCLPIIVLLLLLFCSKIVKGHKSTLEAQEDTYTIHTTKVTTQVVEIDFTKQEGEIELHDDHPDNN